MITKRIDSPLRLASRNRMSVDRINQHAQRHGIALSSVEATPIDQRKWFTCMSLAPLAHQPIFATLTPEQQRRYNQLVGLMQNELIAFFEREFAGRAIPALLRGRSLPSSLRRSLEQFLSDEQQHTQMFLSLNRAAEPAWYAQRDDHILRLPAGALRALRVITSRPGTFLMVLWVMLLMEERSLMISRRYAAMNDELEPRFGAVYRAHAEDEVRHVQVDWHLLEAVWQRAPKWKRHVNAWMLEVFVTRLFLKPRRANVRLIELLISEFPELLSRRKELLQSVATLEECEGYRQLMYSLESTPIARALFEQLPEFARLRKRIYAEAR